MDTYNGIQEKILKGKSSQKGKKVLPEKLLENL